MPVYKEKNGTWRVNYRYTDWTGELKQSTRRGFATRREAVAWEHEQSVKKQASLDMTFGSFTELYISDMKCRLKENTWESKEHIIRTKILPYFKDRRIGEIKPRDVVSWQNTIMKGKTSGGKTYSQTYLKTIRHLQSCRQILRPFKEPCKAGREHGEGTEQGNADLDPGRIQEIR